MNKLNWDNVLKVIVLLSILFFLIITVIGCGTFPNKDYNDFLKRNEKEKQERQQPSPIIPRIK